MSAISVDFFGSLAKAPAFWQEFLKYVKLEGIKVHIISGPWPKEMNERLETAGFKENIHYDSTYSILSFLSAMGLETWFDEDHDSWYSDNDAWWVSKAAICKNIPIQVHFDSDIRFGKAFTKIATRFVYVGNDAGSKIVRGWHNKLKLANTYYDVNDELDEEYSRIMGGMFSM